MVTKIFSMSGFHAVNVTWNKKKVGHYISITPVWDKGEAGLCMGATLTWLKKSIATKGGGIRSADELGSPHLMAIVQGAYTQRTIPFTKKDRYKIDKFDVFPALLSSQSLVPGEAMRGVRFFDPTVIVDLVSRKPCHCLFAFVHPAGESGHVIGMQYDGHIMEMFDSNYGLHQYSDIESCKGHMRVLALECYIGCLGGEWIVLEVTSYLGANTSGDAFSS